jgi:hypothetical protein
MMPRCSYLVFSLREEASLFWSAKDDLMPRAVNRTSTGCLTQLEIQLPLPVEGLKRGILARRRMGHKVQMFPPENCRVSLSQTPAELNPTPDTILAMYPKRFIHSDAGRNLHVQTPLTG